MVSLSFNIEDETFKALEDFKWVVWSEVVRIDCRKQAIFKKYLVDKKLSASDQEFCDYIDWHPVDELPLKKSFVDSMKRKPNYRKMSDRELNKLLGL
jgi:hypothetical protein